MNIRPKQAVAFTLTLISCCVLASCSSAEKTSHAEEGPLDTYMMKIYGDVEEGGTSWKKEEAQVQDLVAKCMTEEGFEYTPYVSGEEVHVDSSEDEEPEWGSIEFAKQYGYGLVHGPGGTDTSSSDTTVNPNDIYASSLSESEQLAYYEVLYGPTPSDEQIEAEEQAMEEGNYTEPDWTMQGCMGKAEHKVRGKAVDEHNPYDDPDFTDLFAAMEQLYKDVEAQPEATEIHKQWATCMADAGFAEFDTKQGAMEILSEEYDKLVDYSEDAEETVQPDTAKMKAFEDREIEVALADATCTRTVKYEEKLQKIYYDQQQKFVDEHKDELDALVTKYSNKKKK